MATRILIAAMLVVLSMRMAVAATGEAVPPAQETMTERTAWQAVDLMTPGTNIGNTLENTAEWEVGWGSPVITREYVQTLARLGFKSVRLPVAWDTYADNGQITPTQFQRVGELIDWITEAGMYCVVNIHWDGGWINSGWKEKFPEAAHYTFTPEAEKKFKSYWTQIARHFAGKNEKLIFEGFSEEPFDKEPDPYATHVRIAQLFIDTVRATGGNNATRLLVIPGYCTDIDKTCRSEFLLPTDTVPGKLLLTIHYYTPWPFVGLNEDASWGKMALTWGNEQDVQQLNELFDKLRGFSVQNDIPIYLGEFSMCSKKEAASSILWTSSVYTAAVKRKMIPALWDTGGAISRRAPYTPSEGFLEMIPGLERQPVTAAPAGN